VSDGRLCVLQILLLIRSSLAGFQSVGVTDQAILIHYSANNFITMCHVLSIIAFYVRMYRPELRFGSLELSYNLSGIIPFVDNTDGKIQTAFSCHMLLSSSFRSAYFGTFSMKAL
jgi:hypothetical protein